MAPDPFFLPKLEELVHCLCDTVVAESDVGLCWCGVVPGGTPAYDYCNPCSGDACGMGFVTLGNVTGYRTFGQPQPMMSGQCDSMLQSEAQVGIMRCYPLQEDGSPPSMEESADVALLLMQDMLLMRKAIMCCYKQDVILGQYTQIGPDGGCVGGAWQVVLDLGG